MFCLRFSKRKMIEATQTKESDQKKLVDAKAYLQTASTKSGDNV